VKALHRMLDDFQNNLANVDPRRIFITHTGREEDAEFLHAEVQKVLPETEVLITTAGSVIASHCGPNTIGMIYLEK